MASSKAHGGKNRKTVAQTVFQLVRFVKGIKKRLHDCRWEETSRAGNMEQADALSSSVEFREQVEDIAWVTKKEKKEDLVSHRIA